MKERWTDNIFATKLQRDEVLYLSSSCEDEVKQFQIFPWSTERKNRPSCLDLKKYF